MGNQACWGIPSQGHSPIDPSQIHLSSNYSISIEDGNQKHPTCDNIEPSVCSSLQNQIKSTRISTPILPKNVIKTLQEHHFIKNEHENYSENIKIYLKDDLFEGQVDQVSKKPKGFGKLFKTDGSLYIGQFKNGIASGKGVYIFEDGSYFSGNFKSNLAWGSNGIYETPQFKYIGEFKDNVFHGEGKQEGHRYTFQGVYVRGKKSKGILFWKDQHGFTYFYSGAFNEHQQFHGKGTLADTRGIYTGDFANGFKQGKGYFKGVNGIKYRGDYKQGKKQGFGIIYNSDDTIAYQGQMKGGLPHGKGIVYFDNKTISSEFIYGIDRKNLEKFIRQQ